MHAILYYAIIVMYTLIILTLTGWCILCILFTIGDGPSASVYAELHGKENRVYCKPRFHSHVELAEVRY